VQLFVILGVVVRKILRRPTRERLLHAGVLFLGYRFLAWDEEPHQRSTPPHDLVRIVKIALRD